MGSGRFYCEIPERAILAVGGDDRVPFLQALISNDIAELPTDHARWAALLTPQGKYLCDFFIAATPDRLLVDVEAGRADDLLARLRRYKLRAKVTLSPLPELSVHAGWGEGAASVFGLRAPGDGRRVDGVMVVADPRLDGFGIRAIGGAAAVAGLLRAQDFAASPFAAWDEHRLRAGIPDGTRDLVLEQSILLEAGFDELHGVSWSKGCYIGQELTARTKYRALIKKRLMPVRIAGAAPGFGAVIEQGGKEVGEFRSSCGEWGLALLRLDALGADAAPLTAGAATLTPVPPDWLKT